MLRFEREPLSEPVSESLIVEMTVLLCLICGRDFLVTDLKSREGVFVC